MGQRLVITIKKGEQELAKGYYHWSAYTVSALATLLEVLSGYDEYVDAVKGKEHEDILLATRMLEASQAGVCVDDLEYVQKTYPNIEFKPYIDRNFGLIALSEEKMRNFDCWSEGDVIIDLNSKTICFGVLFESSDDYLAENIDLEDEYETQEEEDAAIQKALEIYKKELPILEFAYSFDEIPFDKAYELYEKMQAIENIAYEFKKDDTIYSIIC